mgnify:CR=1 FL=1
MGTKVLIVDDAAFMRMMIKNILSKAGYEIVGEAGLSLGLPYDWNKIHTPDPISLAEKIMQLYEIRKEKGEIAREIAVKRYDLGKWTREHQRIFEGLLSRNHS